MKICFTLFIKISLLVYIALYSSSPLLAQLAATKSTSPFLKNLNVNLSLSHGSRTEYYRSAEMGRYTAATASFSYKLEDNVSLYLSQGARHVVEPWEKIDPIDSRFGFVHSNQEGYLPFLDNTGLKLSTTVGGVFPLSEASVEEDQLNSSISIKPALSRTFVDSLTTSLALSYQKNFYKRTLNVKGRTLYSHELGYNLSMAYSFLRYFSGSVFYGNYKHYPFEDRKIQYIFDTGASLSAKVNLNTLTIGARTTDSQLRNDRVRQFDAYDDEITRYYVSLTHNLKTF